MDDNQVSTTPSADNRQSRTVANRQAIGHRPWRRHLILSLPQLSFLFVLAALLVSAGLQFTSHTSSSSATQVSNQVYTVEQVRAGLQQDPSSWLGHTIRVSGVLQGPFVFCGETNPCPPPTLGLVDDGNGILGSDQYLPVLEGSSSAADLPFNVPATYSLQLQAAPSACAQNPTILCYQATLQDSGAAS